MRVCKNCNKKFPYRLMVDGKIRSLTKRKYCLECSPFGNHNTRDVIRLTEPMECVTCKRNLSNRRRRFCQTCIKEKARYKIKKKIYQALKECSCWVCGYDKGESGMYVLHFHHVNPENKTNTITEMLNSCHNFDKIMEEVRKCISICPTCHAEFHFAKSITQEEIEKIYVDKWSIIDK